MLEIPASAIRSLISACFSGVTMTRRWTQRRRFFFTAPHAPGSCACWEPPSPCPVPFPEAEAAESAVVQQPVAHIVDLLGE